jgi:hypothetical protein
MVVKDGKPIIKFGPPETKKGQRLSSLKSIQILPPMKSLSNSVKKKSGSLY